MKIEIVILTLIILIFSSTNVNAGELVSPNDFDLSSSQDVLDSQSYNIDIKDMFNKIFSGDVIDFIKDFFSIIFHSTVLDIELLKTIISNILIIVICAGFFNYFSKVFTKDGLSDMSFYVCYILLISTIFFVFNQLINIASNYIGILLTFITSFLPVYFISVSVSKQASGLGFYSLLISIMGIMEFLFMNILIPMIKIYVSVGLVNIITENQLLKGMLDFIKDGIKLLLKLFITLTTGINIIEGLVLPNIDNTKNTAIEKIVGMFPVVGQGASGVTSVFIGSVNLAKNSLGIVGILVIIFLCFMPFFQILIYRWSFKFTKIFANPISESRILGILKFSDEALEILSKIVISAALIFIISLALICTLTN